MNKIKKSLCVVLVLLLVVASVPKINFAEFTFGITASALGESGKCGDNATYTFDSETGKLVISGTGALYNNAFRENTEIKNVIIGDNITKINAGVFDVCSNLESVHFGDNVTEIDYFAFGDCKSLKSVELSKNLTIIGDKAFQYCENLEKVILYENVTTLKYQSFYDCFNLKSINIPKKVTFIGEGVFRNCNSLADVYYEGSEEEWNEIEIGENNTGLDNAKIHYNSIMPYDCEHKTVTTVFKKQPTCTEKGTKAHYICSDCKSVVMSDGESYELYTNSLTIPALGHDFKLYISNNNATCTKNSTEWAACDRGCGAKDVRDIPNTALSHSWSATKTVVKEPTCTTKGIKATICTRNDCNAIKEGTAEEIALKAHNWDVYKVVIKEPTCETEGEKGVLCKACKTIKAGSTERIPRLGHDWDSGSVKIPADCTKDGVVTYKCKRTGCGKTEDRKVDKLEHMYKEVKVPATCEKDGYSIFTCQCGDEYIDKKVEKFGHDMDYWDEKYPTCTEEGVIRYGCLLCDYTYTESIPCLGHNYEGGGFTGNCTEDGFIEFHCSNCGDSYTENFPALGHTYPNNWSTILEPDCQTKGASIKVCLRCNDVISQTLPKTGHVDSNNDQKCDTCDKTIAVVEPEKEPEEKPCDCDCHAGGIKAFFFNFLNFFAKIFDKSKRVCACGAAH